MSGIIKTIEENDKRLQKKGLNHKEIRQMEDLLLKANVGQLQYYQDHLKVIIKDRLLRGAL